MEGGLPQRRSYASGNMTGTQSSQSALAVPGAAAAAGPPPSGSGSEPAVAKARGSELSDGTSKVISFTDERPVRIVVVDDHPFMRDLISTMLRRQCDRYQVIAETGDAGAAIRACELHLPDLLILDINLPDISGIDAVPRIKKVSPRTRILLCTAFITEDRVIDALRSGAHGFVEKTNTWDDFADAVARVSRGEQYFCCQSSPGLSDLTSPKQHERELKRAVPLSPREREVVTLIAHGRTNKEIATASG
jgi:DNA-binding NarL/FixJ family response regulator